MNSRLTALALAAIALAVMCGGKPSIASKSAAAYREASAKGIPLSAGAHGGLTRACPRLRLRENTSGANAALNSALFHVSVVEPSREVVRSVRVSVSPG